MTDKGITADFNPTLVAVEKYTNNNLHKECK
jgi:hypothetical protein